ncbi:unnamed protein product, partial [Prorocentrum cordatum]
QDPGLCPQGGAEHGAVTTTTPFPRYDCEAQPSDWMQTWPAGQKSWCCRTTGIACGDKATATWSTHAPTAPGRPPPVRARLSLRWPQADDPPRCWAYPEPRPGGPVFVGLCGSAPAVDADSSGSRIHRPLEESQ